MLGRILFASIPLMLGMTQVFAKAEPKWDAYGRPHQLVAIGDHRRLNLYCLGRGSPVVILDGGLGNDITAWREIQAPLARKTRVCAYDRAGNGFSDPGPIPRTAAALAADLEALLRGARIRPPYVLVGASIAGLHTRLFADSHLAEVAGMVLVDPSFEHQVARYEAATPVSTAAAASQQVAGLRFCIDALRNGAPPVGSKVYTDCIGSPDSDLPAAAFRGLAAHITSDSYRMVLSELEEFNGASADEVDASRRSYGALPLIVLTAGGVGTADPDTVTRTRIWTEMHQRMATLSSRGLHRIIPGATHHIALSRPEAVIAAVNDVVAATRPRSAALPAPDSFRLLAMTPVARQTPVFTSDTAWHANHSLQRTGQRPTGAGPSDAARCSGTPGAASPHGLADAAFAADSTVLVGTGSSRTIPDAGLSVRSPWKTA
jgi:pimeloyl-ACP methyl ester carboxylesterase